MHSQRTHDVARNSGINPKPGASSVRRISGRCLVAARHLQIARRITQGLGIKKHRAPARVAIYIARHSEWVLAGENAHQRRLQDALVRSGNRAGHVQPRGDQLLARRCGPKRERAKFHASIDAARQRKRPLARAHASENALDVAHLQPHLWIDHLDSKTHHAAGDRDLAGGNPARIQHHEPVLLPTHAGPKRLGCQLGHERILVP